MAKAKFINILIFGDSIAWGGGASKKQGWVSDLQKFFYSQDYPEYIKIYNLGISANNTNDLLERFRTDSKPRKPSIIIFEIGINDSWYEDNSKDNPGVEINKFKENLIELIKQAREFTSEIIFIGLFRVDESKTKPIPWFKKIYYDNENVKKYNIVTEKLCQENKVYFIPTFDLLDKNDLHDGLHPNSQGHQKIFERVKDFLIENKLVEK